MAGGSDDGACRGHFNIRLALWLKAEHENLTRAVARAIEGRRSAVGGCFTPPARRQLHVEASSAVGVVGAKVVVDIGFVDAHPLQVRSYVIKTATGLLTTEYRQATQAVLVDHDTLAAAEVADAGEGDMWLTSRPTGVPVKPLVRALRAFARGDSIEAMAMAVRAEGLDLSDGAVAVELLRALRFAKRSGDRHLAGLLDDARPRLEGAVVAHLVDCGVVEERLVAVVVDQAFGVADVETARRLGISAPRVRNLRMEARRRYAVVRECFELTTAFRWPLGPSAA